LPSELVLELSPLLLLVDMQLLLVHDPLDGRPQSYGPVDLGVLEDLIGCDLDNGGLLVLDGRRLHLDHRHLL
jgi:hypothetical protein